MIDGYKEMLN
ncbi:unnamed protein product, partial [Rotaria sordida]